MNGRKTGVSLEGAALAVKSYGTPRVMRRLIFGLALVPFLILAVYSYYESYTNLTISLLDRRASTARLAAEMLEEKFDHLKDVAVSIVARPSISHLVGEGKWKEAIKALSRSIGDFPYVDRVFLTDVDGNELAAFPELEEGVGQNFSHRDWYKGVTREWKPYLSEIYKRRAIPQMNVVSLAVPVRYDGKPKGILVLQMRPQKLAEWSHLTNFGQSGYTFFIDPHGHAAGHSKFSDSEEVVDYSSHPVAQALRRGETGTRILSDRAGGPKLLYAFAPGPNYGWGAVVVQSEAEAFADRDENLRALSAIYVLLFLLNWLLAAAVWHAERSVVEKEKEIASLSAEREQLDLFAFVVSHDLQEPLQKMIAFESLVKERYGDKLDDEGRRHLERIHASANQLMRMMEDLRRFSRVRRTGAFTRVDLAKIVREVTEEMRPLLKDAGAEVEVKALPAIRGDAFQLKQLFQHLFANALKFRRPGERPAVVIEARQGIPGFHEIVFRDNGIGFDEKYLDFLFVPFKRLHVQSEYEGSGIGLAICRKVAVLHGGNITAKSVPGKGTEFIVVLPREAV